MNNLKNLINLRNLWSFFLLLTADCRLPTVYCLLLTAYCLLPTSSIWAQQDAMYSQYMFNKLVINPAYAGSKNGLSTRATYRNQWVGFEGSPTIITLSGHSPLKGDKKVNVGGILYNDKIGATSVTGLFGNYAFRVELGGSKEEPNNLAFGLSVGFDYYKKKWSEIEPLEPNDDAFLDIDRALFLPNAGFGIYFHNEKYYLGLSMPKLIENKLDFVNNTVSTGRRSRHYYFVTGGRIDLNENIQWHPSLLLKFVEAAPVQLDINSMVWFFETVAVGSSFRTGDAIVLLIEYEINDKIRIGYSYDFTLSEIRKYSRGAHEIVIGFDYNTSKTYDAKY